MNSCRSEGYCSFFSFFSLASEFLHVTHHTLTERHVESDFLVEDTQVESNLNSITLLVIIVLIIIVVDNKVGSVGYIAFNVVESIGIVGVSENVIPCNTLDCSS
jgi:hypothetical protein